MEQLDLGVTENYNLKGIIRRQSTRQSKGSPPPQQGASDSLEHGGYALLWPSTSDSRFFIKSVKMKKKIWKFAAVFAVLSLQLTRYSGFSVRKNFIAKTSHWRTVVYKDSGMTTEVSTQGKNRYQCAYIRRVLNFQDSLTLNQKRTKFFTAGSPQSASFGQRLSIQRSRAVSMCCCIARPFQFSKTVKYMERRTLIVPLEPISFKSDPKSS